MILVQFKYMCLWLWQGDEKEYFPSYV